ncbi:heterokaryon incompatibility protein (HET) domain-containing protein [Sarocladium implicatum]|nr:heterokaryon incompatibility protein (HET) domain-containing protein [Sarocladium implicatum]
MAGDVVMLCKWSGNLCQLGKISVDDGFGPCVGEDLQDHTGSLSSLQTAREWLSTCTREQPACNDGRDPEFRPSRLLYLDDNQQIRLHTWKDYPVTTSYLTLSHCWGEAQFLKLQESNLREFKEDIPWNALPQTFQDAIQVARHLGLKYLWIDSLCILQDSAQDWITESKMMGNVYKNAVCNIAASDATNSRQGCLYPRNRRTVTPEPLPGLGAEDSKVRYLINTTGIVDRFDRLYSRAWVLQEALLARRTLDCARDQLFWRCDGLVASEELPRGAGFFHSHRMYHPSRDIMGTHGNVSSLRAMSTEMQKWQADNMKVFQTADHLGQSEEFLRAHYGSTSPSGYWASIVEIYSRMSITRDTDRPIALSGIIDTFRPILGAYWAGMWQHLLPGHLVWSIRRFSDIHSRARSRCYRPSTKRAPSWSWLSLEGPIYYREMSEYHGSYGGDDGEKPGDMVLAQLVDVELLSAEDIRLRLMAPMIQATWTGTPTDLLSSTLGAIGFKPVNTGLSIVDVDWAPKWQLVPRREQPHAEPETYIKLVFDVAEEETTVRDIVESVPSSSQVKRVKMDLLNLTGTEALKRINASAQKQVDKITVGAAILRNHHKENGNTEILLLKRSSDETYYPNVFEIPGGKVAAGESLRAALKREVHEESNLTVSGILRPLAAFNYTTVKTVKNQTKGCEEGVQRYTQQFSYVTAIEGDGSDLRVNQTEHSEGVWVGMSDLTSVVMTDEMRSLVMQALQGM